MAAVRDHRPATAGLGPRRQRGRRRSATAPLAAKVLIAFAALLPSTGPAWSQEASQRVEALAKEGNASFLAGELAAAAAAYGEALVLAPDDVELRFNLALANERLGHREEAISGYRSVLAVSPDSDAARTALVRLGASSTELDAVLGRANRDYLSGSYREARESYERYLAVNPEHPGALFNLARSHQQLGDVEKALATYRLALRADPGLTAAERMIEALDESRGTVGQSATAAVREVEPATDEPLEELVADTALESTTSDLSGARATPRPPGEEDAGLERREDGTKEVGGELDLAATDPGADNPTSDANVGISPQRTVSQRLPERPLGLALGGVALLAAVVMLALMIRGKGRRRGTIGGDLSRFPLADVFQFLDLGAKRGMLEIAAEEGKGVVILDAGRVLHAEIGDQRGKEALFRILDLPRGTFQFFEQETPNRHRSELDYPVAQALMDWALQTDESNRDSAGDEALELSALDDDLNVGLPF